MELEKLKNLIKEKLKEAGIEAEEAKVGDDWFLEFTREEEYHQIHMFKGKNESNSSTMDQER